MCSISDICFSLTRTGSTREKNSCPLFFTLTLEEGKHPIFLQCSLNEVARRYRLIRFDLETGKVRILDDQLAFPNGVQLSADKQSVLVCETTLARVIRHVIGGNSTGVGKSEVFIDNLPGIPDNIRLTSNGNYWIAFAMIRHQGQPSLLDRLRNWPKLRKILSVSRQRNEPCLFRISTM